jgi:hypothetical protein
MPIHKLTETRKPYICVRQDEGKENLNRDGHVLGDCVQNQPCALLGLEPSLRNVSSSADPK